MPKRGSSAAGPDVVERCHASPAEHCHASPAGGRRAMLAARPVGYPAGCRRPSPTQRPPALGDSLWASVLQRESRESVILSWDPGYQTNRRNTFSLLASS